MTTATNPTYDRTFVILRMNTSPHQDSAPETAVALLKALWSEAAAEAEVDRLNVGNREHNIVYFWKAVRLAQRLSPTGVS